jgi:hypothetical protein
MIYLSVLDSSKLGTIVHHEMYGFYLVQNYALLIVNVAPPTFNEEMIFLCSKLFINGAQKMVHCAFYTPLSRQTSM